MYENVVCVCPFCDHKSILSLSVNGPREQSLKCPNCGGTMEIKSALDEYAGDVNRGMTQYGAPKKKRTGWLFLLIFGIVVALIVGIGLSVYRHMTQYDPVVQGQYGGDEWGGSDVENPYGDVIFLSDNQDGSYSVTDQASDKILTWESDYDSYYDIESDCYLWYNTDVEPAVWQYWYEGISSDYGDYGWMEHDDDGWWIEADQGNWIPLPDSYDTSGLWYIDE